MKIELTENEYKLFNRMLESYKQFFGEGMFDEMFAKNPSKSYRTIISDVKGTTRTVW